MKHNSKHLYPKLFRKCRVEYIKGKMQNLFLEKKFQVPCMITFDYNSKARIL